jgi:hypothetical protein
VDIGLGGHGHQERQVIDAFGHVRQGAADPAAALPVLFPLEGRLHDGARRAGYGGLDAKIYLLAVPLDQLRLVVERVHLADAAVHEELDDPADPGGVVRDRVGTAEQPGQRNAAEPAARLPEEFSTRWHGY